MKSKIVPLLLLPLLLSPAGLGAQAIEPESTRPGRFDMGKMWTFEYAPTEYFTETYGFTADGAWFERARMAALRIPGCSAAFVSPHGLVVTNHHCVRGSVVRVSREGENLLDRGFYAGILQDERPLPGYYADQLIAVRDVSDEVLEALDRASSPARRREALEEVTEAIEARLAAQAPEGEGAVRVEVTALYNGGRYSAYTYRRYTDVRLVAAAELGVAHFGGDPDNFTYPRYALDFAFLRVYGQDGEPLETEHFFGWGERGVEEGDAVFIIGNPGPTNRLNTVAQLRYQRDVLVPAQKNFLERRLGVMREFYAAHPEEGESISLRTRMFSLSNSLKAYSGRLDALGDPVIMTRKERAEDRFQDSLEANEEWDARWGDVISELAAIQEEKEDLGPLYSAFARFGRPGTESALLMRGVHALTYLGALRMGIARDTLAPIVDRILGIDDHPRELEEGLLAERLADFQRYLGPDHPVTRSTLEGRSVEGATSHLLSQSLFATEESTRATMERGAVAADDPALRLAQAFLPAYAEFDERYTALLDREDPLAAELGRARFAVYGTDVPPDASGSPRITDGRVLPYEYNGTLAPVYTTFFGLYDHYHSYGPGSDWSLPERWLPPPIGLDLGTPLNFISTADTYGGNSGSPAVTPALDIVGLNFDRNIEGLSRDFIYLPDRGRNIMVNVMAIQEAMDIVYDADRIVQELLTHRLFRTEAEADEAGLRESADRNKRD